MAGHETIMTWLSHQDVSWAVLVRLSAEMCCLGGQRQVVACILASAGIAPEYVPLDQIVDVALCGRD